MKRTIVILAAALIVLFACPSTDSMAGPPAISEVIVGTAPSTGDNPAGVDGTDENDGDADGVAGFNSKRGFDGRQESSLEGELNYLKLWWNLFFWFRS
jgi:hypothetical protein